MDGTTTVADSSGQPPPGTPPSQPGISLPSFNFTPDAASEPDPLKDLASPPIDTHRMPGRIEVPFEIVVVCRRNEVLLHPGGYRITSQALRDGAARGDQHESLLHRELRAIVRRRAQVDPLIRPKPRLKFLVETGGSPTFWTVQKQLVFAGLEWPMSVQVAGAQTPRLVGEEALR